MRFLEKRFDVASRFRITRSPKTRLTVGFNALNEITLSILFQRANVSEYFI